MKEQKSNLNGWHLRGGILCSWYRAVGLLVLCTVLDLSALQSHAQLNPDFEQALHDIDIPALNAAEALNRLAEQTSTILLFPYEVAKIRQANALVGRYTMVDALDNLLQGSGLSGGFSEKRVIRISLDEEEQRTDEEGSMTTPKMPGLKTFAAFISSILIGSTSLAAPEDDNVPNTNRLIEEIIVTAQKREQSVLDVPITINVISGDFLDSTNTTELNDVARFLPNVVIQEQGVSLPSFNIRGITDDTAAVAATPRISVFQDGIDISKKTVSSAALYDVNRIEVLKGAQPTLFGVAAANGAISIFSNIPQSEFDASARIAFNTEEGVDFQGMVNLPLNDTFSFRLAGIVRDQDGTVKNQACGPNSFNPSGQVSDHEEVVRDCAGGRLNGDSVKAFRASLLADFDRFSILFRASNEDNDQPGISFKSGSIAPRGGNTNPFSDAELSLGSVIGIDRELESYDVTFDFQVTDGLDFNLIAYKKDVELAEFFDADGSALRIQDAYFENDAELEGVSARFVFTGSEKFQGFIGASYTKDKSILPFSIIVDPFLRGVFNAQAAALAVQFPDIPLDQNVKTSASEEEIAAVRSLLVEALFNPDGTPVSNPAFPDTAILGPFVFEADLEIKSAVVEGTYHLTDSLSVTAGVRYLDETRYTRNFGFFEAEEDFDATLPRFAINYNYSDTLSFYFNYAEGRRSPVVDPNFGATQITKAETVNSYDIGFKFSGDRLALSGAVFVYTYKDFQQSFVDAETFQSNTVTVGNSRMSGLEATLDYAFSDTLITSVSLGLLDAKFDDSTDSGAAFDFGGNRFRLAPKASGAFRINKSIETSDWEIDLDFLASYQSKVFFESSNYPGLSQDGYWIADASVKFKRRGKLWQVELYADNLFDEKYLIDAGNTGGGLGIPTFVRGKPAIAGIRVYMSL